MTWELCHWRLSGFAAIRRGDVAATVIAPRVNDEDSAVRVQPHVLRWNTRRALVHLYRFNRTRGDGIDVEMGKLGPCSPSHLSGVDHHPVEVHGDIASLPLSNYPGLSFH